jgi:FSR family fosmidomycin resistance protein-like MFS transporter
VSLLKDRSFLATSVAHLLVDLINSQYPLLLALFSVPLGLSNALIGLLSMIYSFSGSLSQPFFGWMADKLGTRKLAVTGVIFMSLAFALTLVVPGAVALIFLMGTALGSGAFHPAGTSEATRRGQQHLARLENTATSLFFVFGQSGLFLGPVLGGILLDRWGPHGLLLLILPLIPGGFFLARMDQLQTVPDQATIPDPAGAATARSAQRPPPMFILLITMRAWVQMTMMAFLPKYLSDLGFKPGVYGPIAALFMGGSAVGGILGGWLADRFGNRVVVGGTLLMAVVPLGLFPSAKDPLVLALMSFTAGALVGAPHSILVVQAQHMMPGRAGVASGLILGFTFASGSIGALISGAIADQAGFSVVFFSLAGIALAAAWISVSLRILRTKEPVTVAPA